MASFSAKLDLHKEKHNYHASDTLHSSSRALSDKGIVRCIPHGNIIHRPIPGQFWGIKGYEEVKCQHCEIDLEVARAEAAQRLQNVSKSASTSPASTPTLKPSDSAKKRTTAATGKHHTAWYQTGSKTWYCCDRTEGCTEGPIRHHTMGRDGMFRYEGDWYWKCCNGPACSAGCQPGPHPDVKKIDT